MRGGGPYGAPSLAYHRRDDGHRDVRSATVGCPATRRRRLLPRRERAGAGHVARRSLGRVREDYARRGREPAAERALACRRRCEYRAAAAERSVVECVRAPLEPRWPPA